MNAGARGRWAGPLVIGVTALVLFVRTWRTWPDVLVDFGRELYLPWRITAGDVLYRDLAAFNGPLSAYWNAGWWQAFGSYSGIIASNVLVLAAFLWCAYRLLCAVGDAFAASVALVFFLLTFAFGQTSGVGNFNFLGPYAHEATHGLLLSFVAIASLFGGERLAAARGFGVGCLLGLVLLTKSELSLAALVAIALGAFLRLRQQQSIVASVTALVVGTLVVPAGAALALGAAMPLGEAARSVTLAWPGRLPIGELAELAFYRGELGIGLDHPWRNLASMATWGTSFAALVALALSLDRSLARRASVPLGPLATGTIAALLVVILLTVLPVDWGRAGRPLPLLVLAALVWATLRLGRGEEPEARRRWALAVTLSTFSLVLLAKMFLAVKLWHYGFVLAAPATMVVASFGLSWLPRQVSSSSSPILRGALCGLFIVVGGAYWRTTSGALGQKRVDVGQAGDRIVADARGVFVNRALGELERRLQPGDTLLVMPEGVMLNYLARRPSSTRFFNFMPPELILFGEDRMLEELEGDPPDLVVLVHKDTDEYGLPLFGEDYGRELMRWVRTSYRQVWLDPNGDPPLEPGSRFGVAILTR